MYSIAAPNLSLDQIYASGQCFRWKRIAEGKYIIPYINGASVVQQNKENIVIHCPEEQFYEYWYEYFDIGLDYVEINTKFGRVDDYTKICAARARGVRILKQDLFETIISFVLSQQSNIPRIKDMIEKVCLYCGEQKVIRYDGVGVKYAMFPTPEQILEEQDKLRFCKLGYREKYIVNICEDIVSGWFELDYLCTLDYYMAKKYLMEQSGIGPKVADCICLYALHHMEAFPVDTHIQQILMREYDSDVETFTQWYLDGNVEHIGLLQQYMFYNEINPPKEDLGWVL